MRQCMVDSVSNEFWHNRKCCNGDVVAGFGRNSLFGEQANSLRERALADVLYINEQHKLLKYSGSSFQDPRHQSSREGGAEVRSRREIPAPNNIS